MHGGWDLHVSNRFVEKGQLGNDQGTVRVNGYHENELRRGRNNIDGRIGDINYVKLKTQFMEPGRIMDQCTKNRRLADAKGRTRCAMDSRLDAVNNERDEHNI
jgi:hypothetical protein